jgi:hypothetical protein
VEGDVIDQTGKTRQTLTRFTTAFTQAMNNLNNLWGRRWRLSSVPLSEKLVAMLFQAHNFSREV